jgi:hypothetical protein
VNGADSSVSKGSLKVGDFPSKSGHC